MLAKSSGQKLNSIDLGVYMLAWKRLADPILALVVLVTCLSIFVPLLPDMPSGGLDPSWSFGMNQAVSQGFSIGGDVVFTYGPYASVLTRVYHPDTDGLMLLGGACLAVFYWVYLVLLTRGTRLRWLFLFLLAILALATTNDARFFSVPFVLGLLIFKLYCLGGNGRWCKYNSCVVGFLFVPLGLLPVVKGSMLIICCAIVAICFFYFVCCQLYREALAISIAPVVAMCLFWVVAGQDISELPKYLWSMLPVISGYTEAMALSGEVEEVAAYALASVILLCSVAGYKKLYFLERMFVGSIFFVFLFLAFKAGFVRHDVHALQAGGSILLAAICLCWLFRGRFIMSAAALCFAVWWMIDSRYISTSTRQVLSGVGVVYSSAWNGFAERWGQPGKLKLDFDRRIESLKDEGRLPLLAGTSDIYSFEQSYLISSGNLWAPRPVFQSYSVYTPSLVEKNRGHLQGATAPDNIFFKVQPIDSRYPSLEDGASWIDLLSLYRPDSFVEDYILLKKKEGRGKSTEMVIYSDSHKFGEEIRLPQSDGILFVRLKLSNSIVGRVASIFYKPTQLFIKVRLVNGGVGKYRLISGMASSKFLLSPLVESADEFGALYGGRSLLDGKEVASFTVSAEGGERLWNSIFDVELTSLTFEKPLGVSGLYGLKSIDYSAPLAGVMDGCAGNIDAVNDLANVGKVDANDVLKVQGWLASSVSGYSMEELAYIVIYDESGRYGFVAADVEPRPDVADFFKVPAMDRSGFTARLDTSGLDGNYKLRLAIKKNGELRICPQFDVSVRVRK